MTDDLLSLAGLAGFVWMFSALIVRVVGRGR